MPEEGAILPVVRRVLEDRKAGDVTCHPAAGMSNGLFDWMVVCTGTSHRHVKAISDDVAREIKRAGHPILGIEGERKSDWVLIDAGEVVVHVMTPSTREYYDLDSLWGFGDTPPSP